MTNSPNSTLHALQLSYAPILIGLGHISNVMFDASPSMATKYAGWAFGAAWVAQFVGHGKVRTPFCGVDQHAVREI